MDTIFYHGVVHTMAGRTASAIAIRAGRIALVGSDEAALALRAPDTLVIDLAGRCILPGFADSHMHLLLTALSFYRLDHPDADPQSAAGYAGGGNRLWADPAGFPGASGRGAGGDRSTLPLVEDLSVRRITLRISETISVYELTMFIRMFSEQSFRVKGFLLTRDQGTVLADCVGTAVSVVPYSAEVPRQRLGVLTVLSGSKMPVRSAVTDACKWYAQYIISIEF